MNICYIASESSVTELQDMLREFGCSVSSVCSYETDFIIGMSVTQMPRIEQAHRVFPHIPMINYNWDIYEWVWKSPRQGEYDYKRYGELLKESAEVWVPSECTGKRTEQWFGLSNCKVIKTSVPYYEAEVSDERFVLNPLREIPDPHWGMFEKACKELGIPYKSTMHELSQEEYRKIVASCSFIVSPLYELSTGGLTLIEGTYLGKPCLLSDSPWHGGRDYMGDRAWYFNHESYDDLKIKLADLWNSTPKLNREECKEWVEENYSRKRMAKDIYERLCALKKKS